MSAIHLHCIQLFDLAAKARERTIDATADDPENLAADALTAIVFAAVSAEAFINELGTYLGGSQIFDPPVVAAGNAVRNIEAVHGSTAVKFVAVHEALLGQPAKRGREPFQSFAQLMKLRDWIGHPKPGRDHNESDPPTEIDALISKRLTYPCPPGFVMPWLYLVSTYGVADWACWTSVRMIRATLSLIPPSPGVDGIYFFNNAFGARADELLARAPKSR